MMLLGQYEAELFDLKTITRARPVSLKPPIQHLLCIGAFCIGALKAACTRRLFWRLNNSNSYPSQKKVLYVRKITDELLNPGVFIEKV